MPESVENLEIWRGGIEAVKLTYALSLDWPRDEVYGLTSQARRASVSIPANLAEGVGRGTHREAARFAQIALGSLCELDTLVCVSLKMAFGKPEQGQDLRKKLPLLARRISSYIAYQEGQDG
jgi:four helix bundle protein